MAPGSGSIMVKSVRKSSSYSVAARKARKKRTSQKQRNTLKIFTKGAKNMARNRKYHDYLLEQLQDHDKAVAYLNAALEESLKGDTESQHLFIIALRNVAEAQGGIGNLAKKSGMGRESLYKTLSERGNPKWHTLVSLVIALGLNLRLA